MRQDFTLDGYDWRVTIWYTVDEDGKRDVVRELEGMGCDRRTMMSVRNNLRKAAPDTGFAYSSYPGRRSVIVLHKATSVGEFVNTFEHEKNHVEMHICEALGIDPFSEDAAHLSGDLGQKVFEEALYSIVEL